MPAELQVLEPDGRKKGQVRIKLEKYQDKNFTIKLTGKYTLPLGVQRTRLALPKPLALNSRGKIRAEVDDDLELLLREGGLETPAPQRHFFIVETEQTPDFVDLAWRPFRPEFPVRVVTDVSLRPKTAHVHQQLEFAFGPRQAGPRPNGRHHQVQLRIPENVENVQVISGGGRLPESFNKKRNKTTHVTIPVEPGAKLVLEYDFILPPLDKIKPSAQGNIESPPFEVPLVWPEQATRVETKLRLWCDTNTLPILTETQVADVVWQDLGTEMVATADRLPRRVLSSSQIDAPLWLRLEITPPDREAVVERTLVQVAVDEEGTEHYRVRFLLTELNTRTLKLKLPFPLASVAQITLGQKRVQWHLVENGSVAQITNLPALAAPSAILEVTYQLPRDHLRNEGYFQTGLHAPEFVGKVIVQQVRWQVSFPNGVLPLVVGENSSSLQHWAWRDWLLTPQSALTSLQLEQWLTAPPSDDPPVTPSLVLARNTLEPLYLVRIPQYFWLGLCSGLVLLVGLGINSSGLSSFKATLLLVLLGLVVVVLGLFLPAVLPTVLYGCQPGAVVLGIILLVQWMVQERYRRQVVFMPGFQRLKPGSSLVRSGSGSRPRDASTIDAPANPSSATGSSAGKGN